MVSCLPVCQPALVLRCGPCSCRACMLLLGRSPSLSYTPLCTALLLNPCAPWSLFGRRGRRQVAGDGFLQEEGGGAQTVAAGGRSCARPCQWQSGESADGHGSRGSCSAVSLGGAAHPHTSVPSCRPFLPCPELCARHLPGPVGGHHLLLRLRAQGKRLLQTMAALAWTWKLRHNMRLHPPACLAGPSSGPSRSPMPLPACPSAGADPVLTRRPGALHPLHGGRPQARPA